MDAIRKKMQSLKAETGGLYSIIMKFDEAKRVHDGMSAQVGGRDSSLLTATRTTGGL